MTSDDIFYAAKAAKTDEELMIVAGNAINSEDPQVWKQVLCVLGLALFKRIQESKK